MRYYDPATKKRPVWEVLLPTLEGGWVICRCTEILKDKSAIFNHWQQGYFDAYDEILPKTVSIIQELADIGCIPPIEKKS